MTLEEKISQSTIDITMYSPFLARVLLSLEMVPTSSERPEVPTMGTDGRKCIYNPEWTEQLSLEQLCAVRVHECFHVLLGHHLRVQDRDRVLWNVAADFALNPYVKQAGYSLPAGALLDPQFDGMSAEEIYEKLKQQLLKGALSAPSYGDVLPATGDPQEARAEWKALVKATQWGNMPESLRRSLEEEIQPRPKLADQLVPILSDRFPDDYSFSKPSRRSFSTDIILPSLDGKTGHLVVCIDTSGSIQDEQLKEMWAAIRSVTAIARIDVIYADAAVASIVEDASDITTIVKAAKGGGGTDFRPALAEAEKRNPLAIVYLTDAQGTFPAKAPRVPVIWALIRGYEESPLPWGIRVTF